MASNSRGSGRAVPFMPSPVDVIAEGIKQRAHDQIIRHIETHFRGHALSYLVGAVLEAQGLSDRDCGAGS